MARTDDRSPASLSSLHHHIFLTHILPRLDGRSLAAFSATSTEFHRLAIHPQLWRDISISTWPSVDHPLISTTISAFPSGYRSLYGVGDLLHDPSPAIPEVLISAVDVYFKNVPIFSEVEKIDTLSDSFLSSPFGIDVLQSKDYVPSWVQINHIGDKDSWRKQIKENVTLSWILIDPKHKRAVNLSSKSPVSATRHWLTGEVLVKFTTVLIAGEGTAAEEEEYVEAEMVVTCGGEEGGGEVQVRDVSMRMEDTEGTAVAGKDGLAVLGGAMAGGEKKKGKERYRDFVIRKRENMQKRRRIEGLFDWICSAASTGVAYFVAS